MSSWLTLDWLEELLGKEAAAKLVESFGGRDLYIPEKVYDSHIITKTIGRDAMSILCFHHAKENVEIPKGIKDKKPRVLALINKGISKSEAARRVGVSTRYVRMVTNTPRKPKRNRKKPANRHKSVSEDVRFFASACGLSPKEFMKQAFDLLRLSDDMSIEQQLGIWRQRQRAVAKQIDRCERMALEQRLKDRSNTAH